MPIRDAFWGNSTMKWSARDRRWSACRKEKAIRCRTEIDEDGAAGGAHWRSFPVGARRSSRRIRWIFVRRARRRWTPAVMTSRAQMLELFDKKVAETRKQLAGASDETLMKNWTLAERRQADYDDAADRVFARVRDEPHRASSGAAGVYLRMNDVAGAVSLRTFGRRREAWLAGG